MKEYFNDSELDLAIKSAFTQEQVLEILTPTPDDQKEKEIDSQGRPYYTVKASYVKKRLNAIFGFNYDFQILTENHYQNSNEVVVKGRLTIRDKNNNPVFRDQFGKSSTKLTVTKDGNRSINRLSDIGNTFKSASSDCLKKCASEFGLFWDIYNQEPQQSDSVEIKEELSIQETQVNEMILTYLKKCKNKTQVKEVKDNFLASNEELTKSQEAIFTEYENKF